MIVVIVEATKVLFVLLCSFLIVHLFGGFTSLNWNVIETLRPSIVIPQVHGVD